MCGIVGIVGDSSVAKRLIEGLRRLEYRGYDSAGIAVVQSDGALERCRAAGKISNLVQAHRTSGVDGQVGIAHTRWATHGEPTQRNAHPHAAGPVAIVHNGIIENFRELREELASENPDYQSDTDSELIAHLIHSGLKMGLPMSRAFPAALKRLKGTYAIAAISRDEPDQIWASRLGSPLVVGVGKGEGYVGSDAIALIGLSNRVVYLEDGDWVVVGREGFTIRDKNDQEVERPVQISSASTSFGEKGGYRHFMEKEIHEQPDSLARTLACYIDAGTGKFLTHAGIDWVAPRRLIMSACGTAYYAAQTAKYWFEKYARIPVEVDIASEFRYRDAVIGADDLAIFISQSGETADTLAALRHTRKQGASTVALVNVPESSLAREAEKVVRTEAGPEIGVASTKAFTSQLCALACMAVQAGCARGLIDAAQEAELASTLLELPRRVNDAIGAESQADRLAQAIAEARDVLYLGRGALFPIALEGALKLKEISYIHAEGYAAGELKHGPIALIEKGTPVIVIAPEDELFEKTISNMQEVLARGARVVLVADSAGAARSGIDASNVVEIPDCAPLIQPIIATIPMQMLAYFAALSKGTDVDQPRNLAKSVTVE